MTDRRKYTGKERRGRAGKVLQTVEQVRKKKEEAVEKLGEYEADEGVGVKTFFVCAIAILSLITAYISMSFDHGVLMWTGIAGTVIALTLGEKWINTAKKKALDRFKKDPNRHLIEYLPS